MDVTKNSIPEIARNIGSVFITEDYISYAHLEGNEMIYLWDEHFILPVLLRKMYFLCTAVLPCEILPLNSGQPYTTEQKRCFLEDAIEFLRDKIKVNGVSATTATSTFDIYAKGSKWIPFGSHIVNLNLTEDELWKNVHSKHRNVVRKAEKDGVIVKECTLDDVNDYVTLDEMTWRRSGGHSLGVNYYSNLLKSMPNHSKMMIAYLNGQPQGATILIYDRLRCYYLFAASIDRPSTGAMNLLLWNAMLRMKENGVQEFSFVGCRINEDPDSKYHGIQSFKERFGGSLFEGYIFKMNYSPYKSAFFNALRMVKHRTFSLPKDVIDQEWYKWHK